MDAGLLHIGATVFTGKANELGSGEILFLLDKGNYIRPDEMNSFNLRIPDVLFRTVDGKLCIVGIFTKKYLDYPAPGLTFYQIN